MANLLVVDDDPDSAATLCEFLRRSGHAVTCVANGREALSAVLLATPDVVLLDLMMPEMDGPTFLEIIRSYLRLQALPVVVWTALTDSPMVERARHLKVNAVLAKAKATYEDVRHAVEQAVHHLPG